MRKSSTDPFPLPEYGGPAVYSLIDENGKKYIGSTVNLRRRLKAHASSIRLVQRKGMDAFISDAMADAVRAGHTFRWSVLETFPADIPDGILRLAELRHIEKAGGIDSLYNGTKRVKFRDPLPKGEL